VSKLESRITYERAWPTLAFACASIHRLDLAHVDAHFDELEKLT
jgi:hypothetical protein